MIEDGRMAQLSKKEAARLERELKHLHQNLEGVENMTTPPDAMFVIDSHTEAIAVREARRMGVPVVAVVDTNSDPDQVDWVIPGNDDALRAIRLFVTKIADAVVEGRVGVRADATRGQKAEGGLPTAARTSNTWTPALTNPTRSRKAISWMRPKARPSRWPTPPRCQVPRRERNPESDASSADGLPALRGRPNQNICNPVSGEPGEAMTTNS